MELCLGLSYILDHEFSGKLDVSRCDRLVVNEFPPFHHGSVPSVSYWFGELFLHPEIRFLLPGQQDVLVNDVGSCELDVYVTWFVVVVVGFPSPVCSVDDVIYSSWE